MRNDDDDVLSVLRLKNRQQQVVVGMHLLSVCDAPTLSDSIVLVINTSHCSFNILHSVAADYVTFLH